MPSHKYTPLPVEPDLTPVALTHVDPANVDMLFRAEIDKTKGTFTPSAEILQACYALCLYRARQKARWGQ